MVQKLIVSQELFTLDDTFKPCIIVPFPVGGKIVGMFTAETTAVLLIETEPGFEYGSAHFHALPVGKTIIADSFEYIGTFIFEGIEGATKTVVPVALIPEGGYGKISDEYPQGYATETPVIDQNIAPLEPLNTDEIYKLFGIDSPPDTQQDTTEGDTVV